MAYRLQCDSCELNWEGDDWVAANREARDHEAEFADHWVSIYDQQRA